MKSSMRAATLSGSAASACASAATCAGVGRGALVNVAPYSRKLTMVSSSPRASRARIARSRAATHPGQAASRASGVSARRGSGSRSARSASTTGRASAYGTLRAAAPVAGASGCTAADSIPVTASVAAATAVLRCSSICASNLLRGERRDHDRTNT